jgi:hypothetical protein
MPKNIALNKIYKSRDGLTAVSSNTSIMSDKSNISKNSLPNSLPAHQLRQPSSIASSSSFRTKPINQIKPPTAQSSTNKSGVPLINTNKLVNNTNNNKQMQQLTSSSRSSMGNNNLLNQLNESARKLSLQSAQTIEKSSSSSSLLLNKNKPGPNTIDMEKNTTNKNSLLIINTIGVPTTSSPCSSSSNASSSNSSKKTSIQETKLINEVKRLEALCESRTKELSMLKLELKNTTISFDAISVAFKYLANDLNGFEANILRKKLDSTRIKHCESIKSLQSEIEYAQEQLNKTQTDLNNIINESNQVKQKYDTQISQLEEDNKINLNLKDMEHDLIVKDLKKEKDLLVKKYNTQIDLMKLDSEKLVNELREQLEINQSEKFEMESKIKELEETLTKDKDDRIQRLQNKNVNLEKEIESLKAALDIKNSDLSDLRTKNNQLETQMENYNELKMKLNRYKQDMENIKAVLKNKQDAERRTSEHNRLLAMRIEMKDRENQRLSMANEQLQFRLQSNPNLSVNNSQNLDTTLNNSLSLSQQNNDDENLVKKLEEEIAKQNNPESPLCSKIRLTRASTICTDKNTESNPNVDELVEHYLRQPIYNSTPPCSNSTVKLRSKSHLSGKYSYDSSSLTNQSLNKLNTDKHQFRPVSESFDFNINNDELDQNVYMTRSVIMYSDQNRSKNINDYDCLIDDFSTMDCISSGAEQGCVGGGSTSSSTSHLDSTSNNDDLNGFKSVPCIQLNNNSLKLDDSKNDEEDDKIVEINNTNSNINEKSKLDVILLDASKNNDNSTSSSSSISMNDQSIIILD